MIDGALQALKRKKIVPVVLRNFWRVAVRWRFAGATPGGSKQVPAAAIRGEAFVLELVCIKFARVARVLLPPFGWNVNK